MKGFDHIPYGFIPEYFNLCSHPQAAIGGHRPYRGLPSTLDAAVLSCLTSGAAGDAVRAAGGAAEDFDANALAAAHLHEIQKKCRILIVTPLVHPPGGGR
jgi:hypothetical protein